MNRYILLFLFAASVALAGSLPIKYDTDNGDVPDAVNSQEYNFPAGTTIDGKNPTFNEDFDANTILGATTDNTPAAITIDEQRIVGRITAGNIGALTAAEVLTLLGVESGATADQTDGEIETAYNNQVSVVTQGAAESGTSTTVVRWTPERVKQAIDALAEGTPGGSDTEVQFNDAGVFGTDSLFVWDKLNNYLELGLGSSVGIGTATPQTELDIFLSTGKPTLTLSHDGFEGGRIDIYHTNGFSQPIQGRLEFYDDQANNADFVYYAKENPAAPNTAIEEKFRYDSSENSLNVVGAVTVTDDAYAAGWNASTEVPTKNAVYDKIEETTEYLRETSAGTGLVDGGILTIGTGGAGVATTFSISDGYGYVLDTSTPGSPTLTKVSWTGKTDISVTNIATQLITFICINSAGTVLQSASEWEPSEYRSCIIIGVVIHVNNTTVDAVNNRQVPVNHLHANVADLFEAVGFINLSGNTLSGNPGVSLNIQKSAGVLFGHGINYVNNVDDPNQLVLAARGTGVGDKSTFQYRLSDGTYGTGGDATYATLTNEVVHPTRYESATGVLSTVSPNKWTIQRVYGFTSNNIKLQYGTAEYSTSSEAQAAIGTEAYVTEPSIEANGILWGYMVIDEGCASLTDTSTVVFVPAGKFGSSGGGGGGGTTDHGALTGLGDNDHTQYILHTDLDTEAKLESALTDVTNVFTNNEVIPDANVANDLTLGGATIATSTITLVQSTTPTPTAEGVIEWDSDDDVLKIGDGVGGTVSIGAGGAGDALVADPLSQFAATTSAQFAGVISDETGTGAVVLATSPILVTPDLGTPSALVLTNATGLPIAGLAAGTDGELITWDAAGNPAAVAVGTAGQVLTSNGVGAAPTFQAAGSGDVVGPASATDNAVVVFDSTTGKLIKNSDLTYAAGVLDLAASGNVSIGAVVLLDDAAGTTTLQNIDAIDATTEGTFEAAIDSLANLTVVGTIATGTWEGTEIADGFIPAAITRDTEWDTMAEINAASTDTDAVLDTDIGATVQAYDADLDDLADGSLTGSKVSVGDDDGVTLGVVALDNTHFNATAGVVTLASVAGVTGADEDDVTAADVGTASANLDDIDASIEWEDAADLDSDGSITAGTIDETKFADRTISVIIFGAATATATGDDAGDAFVSFPADWSGSWNLTEVEAVVRTAGTTGTLDLQISRERGDARTAVDVLTTKVTIDSAEVSSSSAATAYAINASNDDFASGDIYVFDVDAIHTTPANGLLVNLHFTKQ